MTEPYIQISQISTGFIEIPGCISLNIFAQGCVLHCQNCHNPELQNFSGGQPLYISQAASICKTYGLASWICWLGGDVTYQSDSFVQFNYAFKACVKKVCLYTGRLFKEVESLLDCVDLVIDGPWQGIPVTDSNTNQQIYLKINNKWEHIDTWYNLSNILKKGY